MKPQEIAAGRVCHKPNACFEAYHSQDLSLKVFTAFSTSFAIAP